MRRAIKNELRLALRNGRLISSFTDDNARSLADDKPCFKIRISN